MKKLIALLLALTLMLSLAACGEEKTPTTDEEKNPTQSQNKTDEEKPEETEPEETEPEETEPAEDETAKDEVSFTEVIVVDNDECLIKITGIEPDSMWGYTLNAYLENKSADKTYMFSVDTGAVNGVQCAPILAAEVAAGKKSNENIIIMDELKEKGVGDYTDIELSFSVSDSEDWLADPVAEETVHIYPYGEDKAVPFVREAQETDNVVVDNEYVTAIVTGYEKDEIWGYTVQMFLVNKTDKNLMFSVEDTSVNGFMVTPLYAENVSPGKCAFSSMICSDIDLEENNITEIEEIEFKIQAYDLEELSSGYLLNETITLNP